jgi:glycerol-3-phosphate acyltransferase PlsY
MSFEFGLVILIGYFVGSVPMAYLVAKKLRGVDLRRYGSGNVGTSNLLSLTSWRFAGPVLAFDFSKGALMVWLAWSLGLNGGEQLIVGLAAVCGHNWPVFLGFRGGRGVLTIFGASFLVPFLNGFVSLKIFAITGAIMLSMILISIYLLKRGPLGVFIAVVSLPILSLIMGLPLSVNLGFLGMVIIFIVRRLTAPQPVKIFFISKRKSLTNRILYDRDIKDKRAWISLIEKDKERSSSSSPRV